jgi:hypothetical protein
MLRETAGPDPDGQMRLQLFLLAAVLQIRNCGLRM